MKKYVQEATDINIWTSIKNNTWRTGRTAMVRYRLFKEMYHDQAFFELQLL